MERIKKYKETLDQMRMINLTHPHADASFDNYFYNTIIKPLEEVIETDPPIPEELLRHLESHQPVKMNGFMSFENPLELVDIISLLHSQRR